MSVSILVIYLLFIKMLILNLWLAVFQMVILIFFAVLLKVMTMEVRGFTCGFVKNSIGRVSWSCVFFK